MQAKPHLPKAALWGEFEPVINQMRLVVLREYSQLAWPIMVTRESHHVSTTGDYRDPPWDARRAEAWAAVGDNHATDTDYYFYVGKRGLGHHNDGISWPYHYRFSVEAVLSAEVAMDLSVVWSVTHADGTPCPPTRLLIYFRHRCGNGQGDASIKGGCVEWHCRLQ